MSEDKSMDSASQARLDAITKKVPHDVLPDESAFLRARRGYLSKAQKDEYGEQLKAPKAEEPKDGDDSKSGQDGDAYDAMKYADLRDEVKNRELDVPGNAPADAMKDALREDDAAHDVLPDEEKDEE